jgi:hypothetical protein
MTKKTLKNLVPGQEVAIMNDSRTGRILARKDTNLYLVEWAGRQIELPRSHLSVLVKGC